MNLGQLATGQEGACSQSLWLLGSSKSQAGLQQPQTMGIGRGQESLF